METHLNIARPLSNLPSALPAHDAAPMDLILIEGFTGQTVIGIYQNELHRPQPLVIDLQAGQPRSRACDTDRIADTIDYGAVCDRLRRLMVEHKLQLLEAFAEAIADILIVEFGAVWVRVKVVKPKKVADVGAMGVQIERVAPPPEERAGRGAAVLRMIGSGMVPGGR